MKYEPEYLKKIGINAVPLIIANGKTIVGVPSKRDLKMLLRSV